MPSTASPNSKKSSAHRSASPSSSRKSSHNGYTDSSEPMVLCGLTLCNRQLHFPATLKGLALLAVFICAGVIIINMIRAGSSDYLDGMVNKHDLTMRLVGQQQQTSEPEQQLPQQPERIVKGKEEEMVESKKEESAFEENQKKVMDAEEKRKRDMEIHQKKLKEMAAQNSGDKTKKDEGTSPEKTGEEIEKEKAKLEEEKKKQEELDRHKKAMENFQFSDNHAGEKASVLKVPKTSDRMINARRHFGFPEEVDMGNAPSGKLKSTKVSEDKLGFLGKQEKPVDDDSTLRVEKGERLDPLAADYFEQCQRLHPQGRHAIVTMASGDTSARMATGLIQSLRDVNTCPTIDIIVMVSGGGLGSEDCKQGRIPELKGKCRSYTLSDLRIAVSEDYLESWKAMGVKPRGISPIGVDSDQIKIPGGRKHFWGMAFNKLNVYNMTEYKKILWLDSDVFVMKNLDHTLFYPELTAAFTNDCCNRNAPAKTSGGFWVIEPNLKRMEQIIKMIYRKSPMVEAKLEPNTWHFGDMSMMLALYTSARARPGLIYPRAVDQRQEPVDTYLAPPSEQEPLKSALETYKEKFPNEPTPKNYLAGLLDDDVVPLNISRPESTRYVTSEDDLNWGDPVAREVGAPVGRIWHMLSAQYDWLPGECKCIPSRNRGPDWFYSVHLSCIPMPWQKPGGYTQQSSLLKELRHKITPCLGDYFLLWLDAFKRALGDRYKTNEWANS